MQNRYAGDVGDYGKIALLRVFAGRIQVGVNWYLVDIPGEKTNDGKYTVYLDKPRSALFQCDPLLARRLKEIVQGGRTVSGLEKLLPGVTFYSAILGCKNRKQWHERAMQELKPCDLVFLDPDNGLLVPSVKRSDSRSIKYVFEEEIAHYYAEGLSVFFYNHRSREPREKYRQRFAKLFQHRAFKRAKTFAVTAGAYSVRDYIFAVQPGHAPLLEGLVDSFLHSRWRVCFREFSL